MHPGPRFARSTPRRRGPPAGYSAASGPPGPGQQGLSLVIVLVLLAAMALGSAAALRSSAGSFLLLRARLMQQLALEQAQAGLRHCESLVLQDDPVLAAQALEPRSAAQMAWRLASTWGSPSRLLRAPAPIEPSAPRAAECLVESLLLQGSSDASPVYVITARGFSPDHRSDPSGAATQAGVAVWLQSTLLIEQGQVRLRSHKRIINPPVR